MISIALLLIKITFVLVFVLLGRSILGRKSAALRHAVLGLALVAMPLVIAGHFLTPLFSLGWEIPGVNLPGNRVQPVGMYEPDANRAGDLLIAATCTPGNPEPAVDNIYMESESSAVVDSCCPTGISWIDPSTACGIDSVDGPYSPGNPFVDHDRPGGEPESMNSKFVPSDLTFLIDGLSANPTAVSAPVRVAEFVSGTETAHHGHAAHVPFVLLLVWATIAIIFLLRLFVARARVAVLVKEASALENVSGELAVARLIRQIESAGIEIRVSPNAELMPCGVGVFHKTILLPSTCQSWSGDQWKSVLLHELAHFQRSDSLTQLIARIHQALFWFHPLVWLLVNRFRLESEIACDDRVIQAGVSRFDYAGLLLRFSSDLSVSGTVEIATVTMSSTRPIETRLSAILEKTSIRKPLSRVRLALLIGICALSSLPIATAGLSDASPADQPDAEIDPPASQSGVRENEDGQQAGDDGAASTDPANRFRIRRNGPEDFDVTGDFQISVGTEYGSATFHSDRVHSIVPVSRAGLDAAQFRVRSLDGTEIVGPMIKSIELTGDSENRKIVSAAEDSDDEFDWEDVVGIHAFSSPDLQPGLVIDGLSLSGLTWHIRTPDTYQPGDSIPGLVLFHGSNSNSENYIRKIVTVFPAIAERFILIGINGEQMAASFNPEKPRFNYTYANYVGRSDKYTGFPGTDRESPALVAETLSRIREVYDLDKVFACGHSQGAFLTYSVMMNSPEVLDGAIAIAGGLLIQCEPDGYEDPGLCSLQRQIPLAIVHAMDDESVDIRLSQSAYHSFLDSGFPGIRFFNPDSGGHGFSNLPFEQAVQWVEMMSAESPQSLAGNIENFVRRARYRDALTLVKRFERLKLDAEYQSQTDVVDAAKTTVNRIIEQQSATLIERIDANADGDWIESFLQFRLQFEFADSAEPVFEAFAPVREMHDNEIGDLWQYAFDAYQCGERSESLEALRRIKSEFYAAQQYPNAAFLFQQIKNEIRDSRTDNE